MPFWGPSGASVDAKPNDGWAAFFFAGAVSGTVVARERVRGRKGDKPRGLGPEDPGP